MFGNPVLRNNVLAAPLKVAELLLEPAFASGVGVADSTFDETYTFTRIPGDADSAFTLYREKVLTADGEVVSTAEWAVRELPVIDSVETDQAGEDVLAEGTTRLTITGSYFGADIDDINVFVRVLPKLHGGTGPLHTDSENPGVMVKAVNVSVNTPDDNAGGAEIVCDLTLSKYATFASKPFEPLLGSAVRVYVQNDKRLLRSDANMDAVLI